ncbi:MAG: chorismate synthase [Proteobacteria bacterium]|nr:chorismate synthase [Pseudomonadota bacterium]
MLRYVTAGESHGQALITVIENVPSNLFVTPETINHDLKRRQSGYGRGGRMKIESDQVQILSGVRHGKTIGSPVTMLIENLDWKNWSEIMSPEPTEISEDDKKRAQPVTRPRPGHADISGAIKYNQSDIRNILERSSARETAARVAAGAFAKTLLKEFGIEVYSWVAEIGGIMMEDCHVPGSLYYSNIDSQPELSELFAAAEKSEVRCPSPELTKSIKKRIDKAKEDGDSLGGIFEIVVSGLPVGLGSHVQADKKLDGLIAGAVMSVQAIKGVEIGIGFEEGRRPGSLAHDEIAYEDGKFNRKTNHAGGIEGGMTNGKDVVVRSVMKPIPTLYKPLMSVDMCTKEPFEASIERSDVCAVPAASVIGEAVVAFEIAKAFLDKFGGDSIEEIRRNFDSYSEYVSNF